MFWIGIEEDGVIQFAENRSKEDVERGKDERLEVDACVLPTWLLGPLYRYPSLQYMHHKNQSCGKLTCKPYFRLLTFSLQEGSVPLDCL
jgi:hypothetical protein